MADPWISIELRGVKGSVVPGLWNAFTIPPWIIKDVLEGKRLLPNDVIRNISKNKNDIELLMTILPVNPGQLILFGNNIPESWAERVSVTHTPGEPNLLDKAIEIGVPLDILYILLIRGLIPSRKSISDILLKYPISIRRDKAYYTALGLGKIPEIGLLEEYAPGDSSGVLARRLFRLKELFYSNGKCNEDKKYDNIGCSNDMTLISSIDEVPPVYIFKHTTGVTQGNPEGTTYCFNLLEIAPQIFQAKEAGLPYENPYTREKIPLAVVKEMAKKLLDLGSKGYPLYSLSPMEACGYPLIDIPKTLERLERFVTTTKLAAYIGEINSVIQKYSPQTVLATRRNSDLIRYIGNYDLDLAKTIMGRYPINDIIKNAV